MILEKTAQFQSYLLSCCFIYTLSQDTWLLSLAFLLIIRKPSCWESFKTCNKIIEILYIHVWQQPIKWTKQSYNKNFACMCVYLFVYLFFISLFTNSVSLHLFLSPPLSLSPYVCAFICVRMRLRVCMWHFFVCMRYTVTWIRLVCLYIPAYACQTSSSFHLCTGARIKASIH